MSEVNREAVSHKAAQSAFSCSETKCGSAEHIRFKSARNTFIFFFYPFKGRSRGSLWNLFSSLRLSCRDNTVCNYGKTIFLYFIIPQIRCLWLGSGTGNDGKVTDLNRLLWSSVSLNLTKEGGALHDLPPGKHDTSERGQRVLQISAVKSLLLWV